MFLLKWRETFAKEREMFNGNPQRGLEEALETLVCFETKGCERCSWWGNIVESAPKFNCRGCVVCLTIGVFVLEAKEEERVERGVGKRVEFMLLTVVDVVVEVRFV